MRKTWLTDKNRYNTLAEDYAAGHTIAELAEQYGVTYAAVYIQMVKKGIPRRSKAARDQRGPKNPSWLGSDASYFGMHKRVRKIRGKPQRCSKCDTTRPDTKYHWANLTGNFGDPYDYIRLCVSCHAKHDNWIDNINLT